MLTNEKKLALLKGLLLTGTPEQQIQARKTLAEMLPGGQEMLAMPVFSAEVKKQLELAHQRSNLVRLVPLRARIRKAVRFFLAPWSRQRDDDALGTSVLLGQTRAELAEVQANLKEVVSFAVKAAGVLAIHHAELQKQDHRAAEAFAHLYQKLTGDDVLVRALESPKPVEPNADADKAIEELRRMFDLEEPPSKL